MQRGKIIGAIVLVVAVGLIVWQLADGPENGAPGDGDTLQTAGDAVAPAGQATAVPAGILPPAGQTRVYTVDPAQSEVYWRIYKAGVAARFGHNHVISMVDMRGSVSLTSDLAAARWSLSFPVAGLVIDNPELRARYGEEFESVPSEEDKEGTKRNMLSESLLNGEAYPEIRLEGMGVHGTLEAAELPVSIEIVGQTIEQTFPASISLSADTLTVTGEYRLTHEDLGLTPFSIFGGAIAVGDDIDFTYRIRAVADGR